MELSNIIIFTTLLFSIGLAICLIKKNVIFILIGIELMFNAANVNFVAFGSQYGDIDGSVFALFVMVIAAAEVALALAIILKVYEAFNTSNLDDIKELKH